MEKKKKIDLHLILKYGRHLICFILVVSFIFVYSFTALADSVSIKNQYNLDDSVIFHINDSLSAFVENGGNVDYLYRTSVGMQYKPSLFPFTDTNYDNIIPLYNTVINNYSIPDSFTTSSITFNNNSQKHVIITGFIGSNYYSINVYVVGRNDLSGNFAIVDGFLVSDTSFYFPYCYLNSNNMPSEMSSFNLGNTAGTSQSSNGFYYSGNITQKILYTDLPIYFSSSDGSTGFTNFSDENNCDFSFADSDNYYNFNYMVNQNSENEVEILGQYYNYAYVDGYIRPTSETDIAVNLSFSFNDYMRLHPNEYEIRFQWYATLTGNNLPSAYGSNYFETVNSLPLSTITGFNGWNQGGNNSQFRYSTTVNSLKNSSDKSLKDAFEQIYIQGGGTANTYNGFSIIDFVKEYYTGLSSETVGKWVIRGNFTSVLTKITLGCKINIVWVGGEPEQTGGKLWITYDTESGSNIVSNDLGVNFNPPAEYSPQYPAEISDSNGNVIVNSGGSNITVNPTTYSNFNAIIEYLYHIDAQEFLALAGNNQNAIQYALNTLSSTEFNGFFPVLKRTFDIIPDQIWNWIKVSFAVILGGAILGISYRMVRWR